jgi:hypothetical protein
MISTIVINEPAYIWIIFDFGDAGGLGIDASGHVVHIPPNTPWLQEAASLYKVSGSLAQFAQQFKDEHLKQQALETVMKLVQLGNERVRSAEKAM